MMKSKQIAPGKDVRFTTGKRTFTYDGNAESKREATSPRHSRHDRKTPGRGLWVVCLAVAGLCIALVANHWESQEVRLIETGGNQPTTSVMGYLESDEPVPTPGLAEPVSEGIPDMLQKVNQRTVLIFTRSEDNQWSRGSGFIVGKHGEIATNYHVLEGDSEGWVKFPGKDKPFPIQSVLHKDSGSDLAVIRVDAETEPLPFGDVDSAQVGERIFALGSPRGLQGTVSVGIISAKRESCPELELLVRNGTKLIQFTAPVSKGSSGGPIVNDQGEVVGMTRGIFEEGQSLNCAISVHHLKELMQTKRLDLPFAAENLPNRLKVPKHRLPEIPNHSSTIPEVAVFPPGDPFPASGGYSVIDLRSLLEPRPGFSFGTGEKPENQKDRKKHDPQSVARTKRARVPETSSSKDAKSNAGESQRRRAYLAEVADKYLERGQAAYLRSNYDTALAFHSRALHLHQEFPTGKDESIATLYNEIGAVCAATGRHRQAIQYYEKALVMLRGILGSEHSRVATCHNNIGASLLAQNDKALGKIHLQKAMDIFQKQFGPHHTNTRTAREWLESI